MVMIRAPARLSAPVQCIEKQRNRYFPLSGRSQARLPLEKNQSPKQSG